MAIGFGYNIFHAIARSYIWFDFVAMGLLIAYLIFLKWIEKYNRSIIHFAIWIYFFTRLNMATYDTMEDETRHVNLYLVGYNWGIMHSFVDNAFPNQLLALLFEVYSIAFKAWAVFWDYRTDAFVVHCGILLFHFLAKLRNEKMNREFFEELSRSKEALEKFRNFLANYLSLGLAIMNNTKTKVLFMNETFKQSFNVKDDQPALCVLKQMKIEFSNPETPVISKENTALWNLIDSSKNSPEGINCAFYDYDNTKKTYEAKVFPPKWDNEDAHAVLLNDISHQEAILSLKIDSQNKEKAISTVAHELRNPVNGILGITQLMEKNFKDGKVANFVSILKTNVNLMLNILNSILDLQQINANKIHLNIRDVNLIQVVLNIKRLFEY